jgi:hypothetical protein
MKIVSEVKSNLTPAKIIAGVIILLLAGTVVWLLRKTPANKVISAIPGNATTGV